MKKNRYEAMPYNNSTVSVDEEQGYCVTLNGLSGCSRETCFVASMKNRRLSL